MSPALASLGSRLANAFLLLLVALGAAGLAVAADQPHTDERRPELTARGDREFEPWRERMTTELSLSGERLSALSSTGRDVLRDVYSADLAALDASLARGSMLTADIATSRDVLEEIRREQARDVPATRLNESNRAFLRVVDSAAESMAAVPAAWGRLVERTGAMVELGTALAAHDELADEAIAAGRETRWTEALERVADAQAAVARATAIREELAASVNVFALDEVLARYRAYDQALEALYRALEGGAELDSLRVAILQQVLDDARAALPEDDVALRTIVADASAPAVADALTVIERARGSVDEALAGPQ